MEKRPISLTIIGWWMVLGAVMTLYSVATMGSNPIAMRMLQQSHVSLQFQQAMGAIGILVSGVCAYGVFRGLPWSRVLYVAWSIVGLAFGLYTSPIKSLMIVGAIFVAVIAFFLFRPAANRWFAAKGLQVQRQEA